ncbi:hypothetical protein NLI96_g2805 [Meripilus lineatus]|uniref:Uncharacterized protein n=1 Tax=Meripilus lineatus TaxID=2056292 RepID=A0AAD5YG85_9APHY|nr:hypothetical protein NLI96_g2805 [Physisporinus lineatus]
MAHNNKPGTSSSLPTARNRLSLILHFPSPSLTKSTKLRRPGSAPSRRFRKRVHDDRDDHTTTDITSVLSDSSDTTHRPHSPTAATSSISIADSLLSTPHQALLPAQSFSHHPSSSSLVVSSSPQEQVPPTTNDLSPEEKMRLMKKVRKLSRVLGEFPLPIEGSNPHPHTVAADPAPSPHIPKDPPGSPSSSKSSSSTPTSMSAAQKRASLRRSFTVGYNFSIPFNHARDVVHRVKSLQSLRRPLTAIPSIPSASTPPSSPMTPIAFAWPTEPPFTSGKPSYERPPSRNIGPLDTDIQEIPIPRERHDSNASSILPSGPSPEQMQRARAAKLTRQLGDSVPPEILLRAASPTPRSQSPSLPPSPPAIQFQSAQSSKSSLASALDSLSPPRRSSSLRRKGLKKSTKNRLSLDIRALAGVSSGPPSAPLAPSSPKSPTKTDKTPLRRTKSMWTRKRFGLNEPTPETEDSNDTTLFRKGSLEFAPLPERQRLLNLFGDKPPTALFQITNIAPVDPTAEIDHDDDHSFRRNSLATIISLSTSARSLSPPLSTNNASDSRSKVRNSYMSLSSVITTSSEAAGVTTTSIVHVEQQGEDITSGSKDDIAQQSPPPASLSREDPPEPAPLPTPSQSQSLPKSMRPAASSQRPSTAPSSTSPRSLTAKHVPPPLKPSSLSLRALHQIDDSPRTPPPFSDIIVPVPPPPQNQSTHDLNATPPPTSTSRAEFHLRQRRAAKLSKFFGVGVSDLAGVLPSYTFAPPAATHGGFGYTPPGSRDGRPSVYVTDESSPLEDNGPMLYLSHGQKAIKETDMYDAIDRLRRMKSC